PGIYEFTFQTVWNGAGGGGPSGQASTSPNIGLYVTKNGTAGGANGLAAFETFPQIDQDQTVIQATGNAVLNVGDYLTARVYAATTRTRISGAVPTRPATGVLTSWFECCKVCLRNRTRTTGQPLNRRGCLFRIQPRNAQWTCPRSSVFFPLWVLWASS